MGDLRHAHTHCMAEHPSTAPLATPAARRAREHILELTREGVVGVDFFEQVSQQLREIIPFDASFWSATDPLTTMAVTPTRVDESLAGQCERYWEREFLIEDVNHFHDLARAPSPVASLYRATGGSPERSLRYRETRDTLGYGDELRAVLRSGSRVWGIASLWREEGRPAFSLAEEKLMAELSGALAEALRRTALLAPRERCDPPEAPGVLVFDASGALESLNDQADAWMQELESSAESDMTIATQLLTVAARARAISAGRERGLSRARVRGRSGRWLVVHGFGLRGAGGDAGKVVVVIEPAKASEVAPIIVEAYGLTAREQQITQMVAQGRTTDEIATRLFLSSHTVRDYLKQVFLKVGVSSRGELVAKIFAEHYLEPLHEGAVIG
ncbi:MAG TPA: LuxR C-terminal-related transcriptional regulator [Candidatus Dormibacteraeota bacterium]|nr:LuxR C-terminal-related transcriptional regulator [Candidatus Dormibacteraeota bacterium]